MLSRVHSGRLQKIAKNMQIRQHLGPKILKVVRYNPLTPYIVANCLESKTDKINRKVVMFFLMQITP
jgi:hypothetical protein